MRNLLTTSIRALMATATMLLLIGRAEAQNITAYRYWFNDDIANLVNVPITATPNMNTSISFNSAALPVGYHLVTVQFKDADAHWSSPYTSVFSQKGGTVTALQYWFDDATASAILHPITPTANLDLSVALDASALPLGLHHMTLRGKDDRGQWSVPYTTMITRGGGRITGYEYWIDDQVDDRVMNTIGPADVVDLISDLPLNTSPGDYTFTIRFRDEAEGWSVPVTTTVAVYVGIEELPGVSSILLFPNPVQDQLTLRLDASISASYDVSILDATGRVVAAPTNWQVAGLTHRSWDTASLAPGTYTIRITNGDRAAHLPFIKQ